MATWAATAAESAMRARPELHDHGAAEWRAGRDHDDAAGEDALALELGTVGSVDGLDHAPPADGDPGQGDGLALVADREEGSGGGGESGR